MSASLKLPNETLLQIINDVHPDDILNLSLTCKSIWQLARRTLQRHMTRQETLPEIVLYGCHRHQDSPHPLTLIADICKDPNVAHYPRSLKVKCCGLFAGLRDDETLEYVDNGFTEDDDIDGGEGKELDRAIARNVMDNFQESIIRLMKVMFTFSLGWRGYP